MKKNAFCKIISGIALACSVMLSSCVTVPKMGALNPVYVTNTKQVNVLSPIHVDRGFDETVRLEIAMNGSTFALLAYIYSDTESMFVDLLSDFGTEMGSLYYDGYAVDLDCDLFPPELKGEYIVNDLQTAFYNEDALKENYGASKLNFTVEKDTELLPADVYEIRKVMNGNSVVEEVINYWGKTVIKNYLRGYQYTLYFAD